MNSEKRTFAAQVNGARSRGLGTPKGKRRSSMNAITRGMLSRHMVIGRQSPESYDQMVNRRLGRSEPNTLGNQSVSGETARIAGAFGEVADSRRLGLLHRYEIRAATLMCRHVPVRFPQSGPLAKLPCIKRKVMARDSATPGNENRGVRGAVSCEEAGEGG